VSTKNHITPLKNSPTLFLNLFCFCLKPNCFPTHVSKYLSSFLHSTKLKFFFHSIVKCHQNIPAIKTACVLQRQNISITHNKIKTLENIFNQQDVAS